MIAERIMQMIGFLFLNNASNTSKQNNVCTIRTHISNNLIVMRYKWRIVFFYWFYSLKDHLVTYITQFLE